MAGDHHRHAKPAGQLLDQLAHLLDAGRIQAVGRLAQDEEPGKTQQRRSQPQALLHPQGIVGHLLSLLVLQADDLQHLPDVPLGYAPQDLDHPQVLLAGEMAIIAGALDQAPHLPQQGDPVFAVHRRSKQPDISPCGAYQPQQHLQGSGLSRSVRAQKTVDASLGDGDVQVVDPQHGSILFAEAMGRDNRHMTFLLRPLSYRGCLSCPCRLPYGFLTFSGKK